MVFLGYNRKGFIGKARVEGEMVHTQKQMHLFLFHKKIIDKQ